MAERIIKLPDVGEGVAQAELVEWHVKVGDIVREDAMLAAVMTDKATVEIPAPADGEILWLGAEVGDTLAVGSPLVRMKVAGEEAPLEAAEPPRPETHPLEPAPPPAAPAPEPSRPTPAQDTTARPAPPAGRTGFVPRPLGERPLASPAVRLRAKEAGIDLRQVPGSGPAGRITHEDLEAFALRGPAQGPAAGLVQKTAVQEVKVVGLRRKIAERMALSKARIPHITIVEEVDVTALEELRAAMNKRSAAAGRVKLTLLPFLMRAMARALAEQPALNALYDDEAGVLRQHAGIHIGIATQTAAGLVVPVVKHVEARDLWSCAEELARLAEAARSGSARREELGGSTITITSLGALGGLATTPVINYPEVAIVGVNKIAVRPHWDGTAFMPRKMMNLSSSFDHRVIDGWDAAVFVQRLKELLEAPAMIFVEG